MLSALRLGALLMPVDDSLVRDTILIIQHLKDNKQKFKVTRFGQLVSSKAQCAGGSTRTLRI